MKRFELNLSTDPTFSTVTGLTNKTFNPDNIVSGRGATEDQLKVVGDKVEVINDYLDEFGCSDCDEQYAGVRATLDALQAAQEECCENRITPENLNGLIDNVQQRLDALQAAQEECCDRAVSQENLDALISDLRDKLNELEAQIEECCNKSCFNGGGSQPSSCNGNEITLSVAWNGDNAQITAISGDGTPITGYYFIAQDARTGMYMNSGTIQWGDWAYSVNSSGAISGSYAGSSTHPYAYGGRATLMGVDSNGCKGAVLITFPTSHAGG